MITNLGLYTPCTMTSLNSKGLKLIHSLQARVASKIFLLLAKVKSLVKSVKLFPVFIHAVECKQAARKRTLSFSGTAQYIHSFYGIII